MYICLTEVNGGWTDRWFFAVDAYKREMLATAFTALSTGYTVTTALESTDEYSQINRLYVDSSPVLPPPLPPGPPTTTVPDVREDLVSNAVRTLREASLNAGNANGAPANARVVSQAPAADTVVAVESTVNLTWTTAPPR